MVRIIETPHIFEWMIPIERDHIVKCSKLIRDYISSNGLFSGASVKVGYFDNSHESSFVAHIQTNNQSFVFKSDAFPNHSKLEALVLSKWHEIGINVPNIIESGNFNDIEYFLMERIKKPILNNVQTPLELYKNNHIYKMGQTLGKMHEVKGTNFGQISGPDLYGENKTITEYLNNILMNKLTYSMIEQKIYDDTELSKLDMSMKILEKDISENKVQSVLCHMDFYAGNVFKTDPLTIIDPDETIVCHPLIDLGSAIVKTHYSSFKHHQTLKNSLINGYMSASKAQFDEKVLNAAIYTQAFRQMRSWYRKGKQWRVKYIKAYLDSIEI